MNRLVLCVALLTGCAGSTVATHSAPPPAPAGEASAAENEASGSDASRAEPERDKAKPEARQATTESGSGDGGSAESSGTGTAASEDDGIRSASRPPADLITAPNVLFVFNFSESEVGAAARQRCEEEGTDQPEVRACVERARGKVPVESIRFVKDESGSWWWLTYNRYKGNLLKWHKVQFSPGPETKDTITLNLIGKDKGIAPMARVPRSLSIVLPNDYSIVVNDAEFGAMTYDAKIGMMD